MTAKIVDLSMVLEEGMISFPHPWHPIVEIVQLGRHAVEGRETRKIIMGTHTGTHIDAPRHFIPDAPTVDEIPLEQINGLASVLDLTNFGPGDEVNVSDLDNALGDRSAERVLLRFDWERMIGSLDYYNKSPYLSENAAIWLIDKGCRLLGMDTPMPDNPANGRGCTKDSPNHKILLGGGAILVEYMINLASLDKDIVHIIVAPIKVKDGDGAPARVFAILE
jgi:arylformamidase|tara:strand:- start:3171 stop:3836 length:666 start_codon:yes stop_codon:yes gene_type:complete